MSTVLSITALSIIHMVLDLILGFVCLTTWFAVRRLDRRLDLVHDRIDYVYVAIGYPDPHWNESIQADMKKQKGSGIA